MLLFMLLGVCVFSLCSFLPFFLYVGIVMHDRVGFYTDQPNHRASGREGGKGETLRGRHSIFFVDFPLHPPPPARKRAPYPPLYPDKRLAIIVGWSFLFVFMKRERRTLTITG